MNRKAKAQAPNGARDATNDSMNLENSIPTDRNNMADMGRWEIVHFARGQRNKKGLTERNATTADL